ncbi:MAG: electron transfer flavoprotein subunit alpha/FixB family protein [Candidatus Bathyarchaeota archaeon]|nr:electron transfer flavoprotein subunit alpha/FixB family protein [Candidatus Bathyarchaeota archaeon]
MGEPKGVWVFSENKDLTLELLGKGNELADKLQTELAAVLLGQNVENQANELIGFGADRVYMVDNPQFKNLHAESYVSALTSLAKQYEPDVLLIGSTKRGKEVASRVATRLETGCVPDCTHLSIDENKRLLMGRMVYGGNAVATHFSCAKPQIATVPPRAFEKLEYKERKGEIIKVDVELEQPRTEVVEVKEIEAAKVKIEEAKVVVAGGRGVEKKEDFKILDELAEVLGGQVAYTRPLCEDRKWFTDWVGLSGNKIKPALYIGCGISGVIQHVAGIRDSQIIVAINKDPEAPIFEVADYMIEGDLYEIVPALSAALKKLLKIS